VNSQVKDNSPYDRPEQCEECGPSVVLASEEMWSFGEFLPCSGESVSLFFPYIPKVLDSDFWVGLAFINQGLRDFDELTASIYEADGSYWNVTFPALPTKNIQSWLLMEGDQGTGFYGVSSSPQTIDQFLRPVNYENNILFGESQMSMFIVGSFEATHEHLRSGAQLDCYTTIGFGAKVNDSYFARQMIDPSLDEESEFSKAKLPVEWEKETLTSAVNQIIRMTYRKKF